MLTLAELAAETLSQKHRRMMQAKCRHEEVYSSTVTSADGTFTNAFCLDCGKTLRTVGETAMTIAFERAAEIVAKQLASFRLGLDADDPFAYTEYEQLCAGHIVGALWGQGLLNTGDEKWVPVESECR